MELLGTKTLTSSTGAALDWYDFNDNVFPDPVCVVVALAHANLPADGTLSIETYLAGPGRETSYGDAVTGTVSGASSDVYVQSLPTIATDATGYAGDAGNGWKVTASTAVDINVELYLIAGTTRVGDGP